MKAREQRRGLVLPINVKSRILEEAVELVALHGPSAMTIRDVTEASGVNVAAVSYHFGSKDELLKEVMLTVFAPVRAARQDALARALDLCAPDPASLDMILTALIKPLVEAPRGRDGARTVVRMMQHLRANPTSPIASFVWTHYDYGAQSFIDALARAMPDLTRPEIIWRYEFARGSAIHMLSICEPSTGKLEILAGRHGMVDVTDDSVVLESILHCALLGVGAGPTWNSARLGRRPVSPARSLQVVDLA